MWNPRGAGAQRQTPAQAPEPHGELNCHANPVLDTRSSAFGDSRRAQPLLWRKDAVNAAGKTTGGNCGQGRSANSSPVTTLNKVTMSHRSRSAPRYGPLRQKRYPNYQFVTVRRSSWGSALLALNSMRVPRCISQNISLDYPPNFLFAKICPVFFIFLPVFLQN